MKLVRFESKHYDTVTDWWKKHQHPVVPFNMLPFGLIAIENDELIAVSWIYFVQNCDIAQIAWTTTNPNISAKRRYNGVNFIVQGLLGIAKSQEKTNVMCFSSSSGLNKIFNKNGLKQLTNHTLLYGSLGAF